MFRTNCSYNAADVQALGKVTVLKMGNNSVTQEKHLFGQRQFDMFGAAVTIGQPFGGGHDILAVAATGSGEWVANLFWDM